jgi:hypothetical protein
MIRQTFHFPANFLFKSNSAVWFINYVNVSATQSTNGLVYVSIGHGYSGFEDSSYFNINVGTTYAIVASYAKAGTTVYPVTRLVSVNANGSLTLIQSVGGSYAMTNVQDPDYVQTQIATSSTTVQLRVYETMFLGLGFTGFDPLKLVPRLWAGSRKLIFTYYTITDILYYLMPPYDVMDGSAYDRASILESEINALQSDLDAALTDIGSLETDISALSTALSNSETGFLAWLKTQVTNVYNKIETGVLAAVGTVNGIAEDIYDGIVDKLSDLRLQIIDNLDIIDDETGSFKLTLLSKAMEVIDGDILDKVTEAMGGVPL